MSTLLLVRHGQLELNKPEKFWGQTDIKLSPAGLSQAERLRDRLAPEHIDMVYASALSRTIDSAKIIAAPHNLEVTIDPDLNEMHFGEFEGLTFDQITEIDPDTAKLLAVWDISPRFPGGESLEELFLRVKRFIGGLNLNDEKTLLVVAHAGPLRMMITHLLGLEPKHWRKFRLQMGSLSIINTYPTLSIMTLLNDVSHHSPH